MSRALICTVGTSLLTNRDRPWAGWKPRPRDPFPDPEVVDHWLASADATQASAETNTLKGIEIDEGDTLALLHSDTDEGRFCAERLVALYRPRCRDVILESVGKLNYGSEVFTTGLKSLVSVAVRLIRGARDSGRLPILCATGGFKAEIAFLNLLGALLEIEVVYIHELHRALVRLPRLPLSWNTAFVLQNKQFFLWIDEAPRPSHEVESRLKAQPELRWLVEEGDDGNTYLSAAGDLLFKAANERDAAGPRATWPDADPRPPGEKNQVSSVEHHRPSGWEGFVNRLCEIDCVRAVRYDAAAHGGQRIRVLDANSGVIGVLFGSNNPIPLRVETTARGKEQCELVAEYLRNLK